MTNASKALISLAVPLTVPYGGTGLTTLTEHALLLGTGVGNVAPLAVATHGQLPIGSTGADPVLRTLTAGNDIDITNAAGTITIASSSNETLFDAGTSDVGLDSIILTSANPFEEPIMLTGAGKVTRHIRVSAASFYKKDDPPAENVIGIFPVLQLDPVGEEQCYYSIITPFRMEAGTALDVIVDWSYVGDDAGKVVWGVEFITIKPDEVVDGSTSTITGISAGGHTGGELVRTELTSTGSGIAGAVARDIIGIRLYRDADDGVNDTLDEDANLIQIHLHFTMDKLGE